MFNGEKMTFRKWVGTICALTILSICVFVLLYSAYQIAEWVGIFVVTGLVLLLTGFIWGASGD